METLKRGSRGEAVKMLQTALNLYADGIFGRLTEEAVREFQKANGLRVDGIVGNNTWAMLHRPTANGMTIRKTKRNIKEIIVHCSATPEGRNISVEQIRQWHLQRGFSDVGYHYIVYRDGSVHIGRDVDIAGAHCTGHNTISIGVCYIGGCDGHMTPKDTRTPAQAKALRELLTDLKEVYPKARIHSHKDFANKACPSFDATAEYKDI